MRIESRIWRDVRVSLQQSLLRLEVLTLPQVCVLRQSPSGVEVEFDSDEDYRVALELGDDGDAGDQSSGCDDDSVVGSARNRLGEVVELEGEDVGDGRQIGEQEVGARGLAVRTTFGSELCVQLLKEAGVDANLPRVAHKSVFGPSVRAM